MRKSRPSLFRGRHFQEDIIVLCVRWYLRYPLSYRNLEEMMEERVDSNGRPFHHRPLGFALVARSGEADPAEIVSQIGPGALMKPTSEWQVAGRICIEPLDSAGDTIDFLLRPYRDRIAAKGFLQLALSGGMRPRSITVDGHPAYHP